jgi:hypothetical protein
MFYTLLKYSNLKKSVSVSFGFVFVMHQNAETVLRQSVLRLFKEYLGIYKSQNI